MLVVIVTTLGSYSFVLPNTYRNDTDCTSDIKPIFAIPRQPIVLEIQITCRDREWRDT